MSKEKKLALSKAEGLIPDLRFPEIVESWDIISLSNMCLVYRGGTYLRLA